VPHNAMVSKEKLFYIILIYGAKY
jgi:hypothetical protein